MCISEVGQLLVCLCVMWQFTQAHKSMYAIYCSNYDSAETLVAKLKKRSDFYQSLEVSECVCGGGGGGGVYTSMYMCVCYKSSSVIGVGDHTHVHMRVSSCMCMYCRCGLRTALKLEAVHSLSSYASITN